MTMPPLTTTEKHILLEKGTEPPFSGKYHDHFENGMYLCRQCGSSLFSSHDKFSCTCGWPAFDAALANSLQTHPDPDGKRIEIVCAQCQAHLGHVFTGEKLTQKNTRYCVNSTSLVFKEQPMLTQNNDKEERAIFAGGCFWGIENAFQRIPGVVDVTSGYTGGTKKDPTYEEICTGTTGHTEAVLIRFNPEVVSYEALARLFFEIHDPTQLNRQGVDIGTQYRSAIFYENEQQKTSALSLIHDLEKLGWEVVTEVEPLGQFYEAEAYHQNFTQRTGRGKCHFSVKRFEQKPL